MLTGIGSGVFVVLTVLVVLLFLQVKRLRQETRDSSAQIDSLQKSYTKLKSQVDFLNAGSMGIGQRLMNTEKRLSQSLEKQDEMVNNNSDELYRRQAERILKNSKLPESESDDAVTRSEARLMALVGQKKEKT